MADLLKKKREEFVFMDVGANQALYSVLASKNPSCTHIHAFEPVQQTADLAQKNIQLNDCANVSLHRVAISNATGKSAIHVDDAHSGKATLREIDKPSDDKQVIETIDAVELEKIVSGAVGRIVAKIDVEGHELVVLEELLKTSFFDRIDTLFYECDRNWFDPATAETLLKARGFDSFDAIGEGRHFDVLARRKVNLDVVQ
ncbi:MAG: FkbM family methyltransferase [Pseudomonadota bacterium]